MAAVAVKEVIVTKTGAKLGPKGLVANTAEKIANLFAQIPRGVARSTRKLLRANGLTKLSCVSRLSPQRIEEQERRQLKRAA